MELELGGFLSTGHLHSTHRLPCMMTGHALPRAWCTQVPAQDPKRDALGQAQQNLPSQEPLHCHLPARAGSSEGCEKVTRRLILWDAHFPSASLLDLATIHRSDKGGSTYQTIKEGAELLLNWQAASSREASLITGLGACLDLI